MKVTFKRPSDLYRMPETARVGIRKFLSVRLGVALEEIQGAIMQTPVYTGRTLVNYRWSLESPITELRGPVKNPDLPGKTSAMSIGEEPRRAANSAVLEDEFASVFRAIGENPFQKIFLRNNVPNFDEIEYGSYAADARTPAGGMTRRGEIQLQVIVRGITRVG